MRQRIWMVIGLSALLLAGQVEAFTSKGKGVVSVGASGVTETISFATTVVSQGTADTPSTISFGTGGNTFRDSGAAIRVTVTTNIAANRVVIYTDNLSGSANPQAQVDTSTGIDGGGLVGVTDRTKFVPLFWGVEDTNVNYTFSVTNFVGNANAVVDRAHVASFTTPGSSLDNQAMVLCRASSTTIPNATGDGLYPQRFGTEGLNENLCSASAPTTVVSEELVRNIATVSFGCSGTTCTAPNLATPSDPSDTKTVTSPYYLPIGADFTNAAPQNYATSTLTVELVQDTP